MLVEARAKVNWTLDILGTREDGYHLMDMLMQPISLSDLISLEEADDIFLTAEGNHSIPSDRSNLAWRAAAALQQAAGITKGVRIHVTKRIPSGAGLGGGSADAAGVLWGLNILWETGFSDTQLEQIGLTIGADVPFCLRGGLARVSGIGEVITSLPGAPTWPMVIIQPCEGLSTGAVFRAYHASEGITRPDTAGALAALQRNQPKLLTSVMGNVLEGVSREARPAISTAIDALYRHGAICAAMSGSGSAVFGVFPDSSAAETAAGILTGYWATTLVCHSCEKSLVLL